MPHVSFSDKPRIIKFIFVSSFNGEFFHTAGSSTYAHNDAGIANYLGKALTTGCGGSGPACYVKTELMDMNTLTWSSGPEYPFASS